MSARTPEQVREAEHRAAGWGRRAAHSRHCSWCGQRASQSMPHAPMIFLCGTIKLPENLTRSLKIQKNQTPQDLVVKFQCVDIADVILRLVLRPRMVYRREVKA